MINPIRIRPAADGIFYTQKNSKRSKSSFRTFLLLKSRPADGTAQLPCIRLTEDHRYYGGALSARLEKK